MSEKQVPEIFLVGDDIEKPTYPDGYEIYRCTGCFAPLDEAAMSELGKQYHHVKKSNDSYTQYYLASRHAGSPKYFSPLIKFDCPKCHKRLVAVFYHKFRDTYFPINPRECRIALIDGAEIDPEIDGVFERDDCQTILQKLLMRWTFFFEIVYVAVPFIGNSWQSPEERLNLVADFLSCLDPEKTIWVTRTTTLNQIETDFNTIHGNGVFDALMNTGRISPLIKNAFPKTDFHAKFYAGVGSKKAEALIGSHNLHGGKSLENISFRDYEWKTFLAKYILGLGVVPIKKEIERNLIVAIFEQKEKWGSGPIQFERAPESAILEFISKTFIDNK